MSAQKVITFFQLYCVITHIFYRNKMKFTPHLQNENISRTGDIVEYLICMTFADLVIYIWFTVYQVIDNAIKKHGCGRISSAVMIAILHHCITDFTKQECKVCVLLFSITCHRYN